MAFSAMCRAGLILQCSDVDTSGMKAQAEASAQLGNRALDWFTAEAARTQGQRDQTTALQNDIATQQRDAMATQNKLASSYANYETDKVLPLKQQIISEAQGYDTAARQQAAADTAAADVRGAMNKATASTGRTLARMGYNPAVSAQKTALQGAIAEAGAATGARRAVENTGRAMRMDAAGMQSNATTAANAASGAAQTANGAAGSALGSATSAAGLMGQGFGSAMSGYGQAGSLYGSAANADAQSGNGFMSALGSLGSVAGNYFGTQAGSKMLSGWLSSDENMKCNTGKLKSGKSARMTIEQMQGQDPDACCEEEEGGAEEPGEAQEGGAMNGEDAREAIEATPVHEGWAYKPGSVADDGGQPHDGPMAQDIGKTMPGARVKTRMGQMIDPITIQGNLLAAVGDLSKEVKQIKRVLARMEA